MGRQAAPTPPFNLGELHAGPQREVSVGWAWRSGPISRACGTTDCMDYSGAGTREPSLPLQRLRTFPPPVRVAAGPSVRFPARASRRGAPAVAAPQDLRHSRETYPRCGFLTAILELGPCRAFTEMAAVADLAARFARQCHDLHMVQCHKRLAYLPPGLAWLH